MIRHTHLARQGKEIESREIIERIEGASLVRLDPKVISALEACPDPIRAAIHLERWLAASPSPATFVSLLNEGRPDWLLNLLACSSQVADILVQNPEMGAIFFESWQQPTPDGLMEEGQRLLEVAHSSQHRLDRLRLLKQRWILRIAFIEVNGLWTPGDTLQAISDLAEAIIRLTLDALWRPFAQEKGLPAECPIQVIAFGKLGGYELNYSSDIDLAYVVPDQVEDITLLERFCTQFGRAIDSQMGRGHLYRVDLRLRPYGASGPILNRISAVEAYYDRYAEVWEHLALVRSRMITAEGADWWQALRKRVAFGGPRSSWQIEELVEQRQRLEEIQTGDDLKRGAGGIRDIEFLTQTLQLAHTRQLPQLDERRTLAVLPLLAQESLLRAGDANFLAEAYVFLRSIEHRLQLEANVQTHELPDDPVRLNRLAASLGFSDGPKFLEHLRAIRAHVRSLYSSVMLPLSSQAASIPDSLKWLGEYAQAAMESEGGMARAETLVSVAPGLIEEFQIEPGLIEQLITGEILEAGDLNLEKAPNMVKAARTARIKRIAQWALTQEGLLSDALDEVTDAVLRHLLVGLPLDCVALGSYATHDTGLTSDADLALFCPSGVRHLDAEQAAHAFLQGAQEVRTQGFPLTIDLRLRPDGKKGVLARTYEGFQAYAQADMDSWERLACGRARLIAGSPRAVETLLESARGLRLDDLDDLLSVKRRLETELSGPDDLKHGAGGFDDVAWLIQLLALAEPQVLSPSSVTTPQRLNDLRKAGLLSESELESLVSAHRTNLMARWHLECGDPSPHWRELLDHWAPGRKAIRRLYERKVAELQSR